MATAYKLLKKKEAEIKSFADSLVQLDPKDLEVNPDCFASLIGLRVEDFFEDFELFKIEDIGVLLVEKSGTRTLGFNLLGKFKYGDSLVDESFTIWIGSEGYSRAVGFKERISTRTLSWADHISPIVRSIGLIT